MYLSLFLQVRLCFVSRLCLFTKLCLITCSTAWGISASRHSPFTACVFSSTGRLEPTFLAPEDEVIDLS